MMEQCGHVVVVVVVVKSNSMETERFFGERLPQGAEKPTLNFNAFGVFLCVNVETVLPRISTVPGSTRQHKQDVM